MAERPFHRTANGELDFWRHIEELRKTLVWSLVGWIVGASVAYYYWMELWGLLIMPLRGITPKPKIIVTSPTGTVTMSFQVALVAGSLLAAPWVFWQIWKFVSPALVVKEKRIAAWAMFWVTVLFAFGVVLGYFTILPMTVVWLAQYGQGLFEQMWSVDEYTSMVVKLLAGFALMFEFPLVTWVTSSLGLVGPKQWLSWSRGAIVVIFIIAAILTPPDPVSQCILAAPMLVLYFAGVGTAWLAARKKVA